MAWCATCEPIGAHARGARRTRPCAPGTPANERFFAQWCRGLLRCQPTPDRRRGIEPHGRPRATQEPRAPGSEIHLAQQRPSFLKRQKEQARLARATQKRVARQERRLARAADGGTTSEPAPEAGEELMSADEARDEAIREDDAQEAKEA